MLVRGFNWGAWDEPWLAHFVLRFGKFSDGDGKYDWVKLTQSKTKLELVYLAD